MWCSDCTEPGSKRASSLPGSSHPCCCRRACGAPCPQPAAPSWLRAAAAAAQSAGRGAAVQQAGAAGPSAHKAAGGRAQGAVLHSIESTHKDPCSTAAVSAGCQRGCAALPGPHGIRSDTRHLLACCPGCCCFDCFPGAPAHPLTQPHTYMHPSITHLPGCPPALMPTRPTRRPTNPPTYPPLNPRRSSYSAP